MTQSGAWLLVVEDEEPTRRSLSNYLVRRGYRVDEAATAAEALRAWDAHRPDLILMDIQLPEISGLEVTKWIKEDDDLRAIPVIAVTAFAMKGDEERIRQGGCEAYLSKPISVAKFIETVKAYLGDG